MNTGSIIHARADGPDCPLCMAGPADRLDPPTDRYAWFCPRCLLLFVGDQQESDRYRRDRAEHAAFLAERTHRTQETP